MKNIISLLSVCLLGSSVFAQTLQLPSLNNTTWYSASERHNSSMITRSSGGQLFAGAYNGGNPLIPPPPLYITNATTGITIQPPTYSGPGPGPSNSYLMPDVILGNDPAIPTNNYYVGVSYTTNGDVKIDIYNILCAGSTLSCGYTRTIGPLNVGTTAVISHLDIIAEAGNTAATGYPYCDKFVITWDDNNNDIWAAYGSLSSGLIYAGPMLIAAHTAPGVGFKSPDVAAIQRNIAPPMAPPMVRDYGLITFLSSDGNTLYYTEWDVAGSGFPATALDNIVSVTPDHFVAPRIDALDDYTSNNASGISKYKIVAQVDNGTNKEIRTYDNLTSSPHVVSSSPIDISTVSGHSSDLPPYDNFRPVVAYAGEFNYSVLHFMKFNAAQPHDILFMEPIDKTNPSAISSSPTNQYFWTNSSTGTAVTAAVMPDGTGHADYSSSISAPVNNCCSANTPVLCTWAQKDPLTGISGTMYKLTPTSAYAFKPGTSAVATAVRQRELKAYPNPALSDLSIINPSGQDAATDYIVTDISGRSVLHGSLQEGLIKIGIGTLVPGNYILQTLKNGMDDGKMTFVKK